MERNPCARHARLDFGCEVWEPFIAFKSVMQGNLVAPRMEEPACTLHVDVCAAMGLSLGLCQANRVCEFVIKSNARRA